MFCCCLYKSLKVEKNTKQIKGKTRAEHGKERGKRNFKLKGH